MLIDLVKEENNITLSFAPISKIKDEVTGYDPEHRVFIVETLDVENDPIYDEAKEFTLEQLSDIILKEREYSQTNPKELIKALEFVEETYGGKPGEYKVTLKITGKYTLKVNAQNIQDAVEKVKNKFKDNDLEILENVTTRLESISDENKQIF